MQIPTKCPSCGHDKLLLLDDTYDSCYVECAECGHVLSEEECEQE